MMGKQEEIRELRQNKEIHYNCAQAVLIPFAEECGFTRETAFLLAKPLGHGVGIGGICGALSGALMVLGAKGGTPEQFQKLTERFQQLYHETDCEPLIRLHEESGDTDRKAFCDHLIYSAVETLEELLEEKTEG